MTSSRTPALDSSASSLRYTVGNRQNADSATSAPIGDTSASPLPVQSIMSTRFEAMPAKYQPGSHILICQHEVQLHAGVGTESMQSSWLRLSRALH